MRVCVCASVRPCVRACVRCAQQQAEDDFLHEMEDEIEFRDMDEVAAPSKGSSDSPPPTRSMHRVPAPPPPPPHRAPPPPRPYWEEDESGGVSTRASQYPSSHRADIELIVCLEDEEEMQLRVPLAGVSNTEDLLRLAFDACAETVGMELESEGKQIVLRYVTAEGREKRLNTKVPWEDLRSARSIIIKLQRVGSRR